MQDASWPPAVVCEPSLKDDWVLFISLDRHSSKGFCFLNGEVLFPKSTTDASTNTSDEKLPTNVNNFVFTCGATGINFTSPSCCFGHFYCWIVQPTSTPSWRGHFTLTFWDLCTAMCITLQSIWTLHRPPSFASQEPGYKCKLCLVT